MQFKHPEILYALLLLIIPILVHLFQLQRFIKVPFTNVKILKNIEKQTRKSARLKKWLILITRLLIFACLIFAFAQPYFSDFSAQKEFNTTVYLDNSFSMQAKGDKGELLKSVAQQIIENNTNPNSAISFITNDQSLENLNLKGIKSELITLKYYPHKLDLNTVLLKAKNLEDNKKNSLNKIILISDFQDINLKNNVDFSTLNSTVSLVKLTPKKILNSYIDSVYIEESSSNETTIKVVVKNSNLSTTSIPISLFDNEKLIGKTTAKFNNTFNSSVQFTIPKTESFNGKISLIDNALEFDNNFYFSISKPEKINILSIGKTSPFLAKIYTTNEFNFNTTPPQNLNYNTIQNQHLIILNELETISTELKNALNEFSEMGGNLVIIPSSTINLDSYNSLLRSSNFGKIIKKVETEHKIIAINYEHPLINDVFEKRVDNFQYPSTKLHYQTTLNRNSSIINLDNNNAFISSIKTQNGNFYLVSSPLSIEVSNFIQSPLVVPIFYNFAKNSLKTSKLYYTISPENELDLKVNLQKDNVLKIVNEAKTNEFIPLQTISKNKVSLKLQNAILKSGFYHILNNENPIKTIAFNYNKEESNLTSINLKNLIGNHKNVTISPSITAIFDEINNQQKINWVFKWFLAFSILFLLIEMLILKYFNK